MFYLVSISPIHLLSRLSFLGEAQRIETFMIPSHSPSFGKAAALQQRSEDQAPKHVAEFRVDVNLLFLICLYKERKEEEV
jgi:hypothetical protein